MCFGSRVTIDLKSTSTCLTEILTPIAIDVAKQVAEKKPFGKIIDQVLETHKLASHYFVCDSQKPKKFRLRPQYLHMNADPALCLDVKNGKRSLHIDLKGPLREQEITQFLGCYLAGRSTLGDFNDLLPRQLSSAAQTFIKSCLVEAPSRLTMKKLLKPGIHRLQHSCLLFRSLNSGILIDPVFHSAENKNVLATDLALSDLDNLVDAILISHSHGDHWHIPTLLAFRKDLPIYVPAVKRGSFINRNMAKELMSLGFTNVKELNWFSPPEKIGDIQVQALPFYGEQPSLKEFPDSEDLWQQGNTYLIDYKLSGSASRSCWVVVDAGNDARGSSRDVAEYIAEKFGGVDSIAANLRSMVIDEGPIYGSGQYWFTLRQDQIVDFPNWRGHQLNLGPAGVAEICKITRASHFLPYAHWWQEPGKLSQTDQITSIHLARELQRRRGATQLIEWNVGGHFGL